MSWILTTSLADNYIIVCSRCGSIAYFGVYKDDQNNDALYISPCAQCNSHADMKLLRPTPQEIYDAEDKAKREGC